MLGARALTKIEIEKLLSCCPSKRERLLIRCSLAFGLRISETVPLRFLDFKGTEILIKGRKGSKPTIFPIPQALKTEIEQFKKFYKDEVNRPYYRLSNPLFRSKKGKKSISVSQASRIFKEIVKKSGINPDRVTFHSLRKSYMKRIDKRCNHNVFEIRKYSRHQSIDSVQYYLETMNSLEHVNDLFDDIK